MDVEAMVWLMLTRDNEFIVPEVPTEIQSAAPLASTTCKATSEYVRVSAVVPAGTFGGSVSKTVNEDLGKIDGLATNATEIIKTATSTAAKPYLVVHFRIILHRARVGKTGLKPTFFKAV